MFKRLFSLCLILSMVLSISSYALASNQAPVQDLSGLGIIQGDGTGFNLSGQLKRSEAITIIARLIGAEDTILAQKAHYSSLAKFSDVKSSAWYAAYVGYMADNKIVLGYPNGTFQPEKSLSEKEMLSMLLSALGYTSGTDYKWDSLYQDAYTLKVVNDVSYATKTIDNTNYLRSNCFDLTRHIIETPYKGTSESMADVWRKNGRYTDEQLLAANVATPTPTPTPTPIPDALVTSITKTEPLNATTVQVTLNEPVQQVDKALLTITAGSTASLPVSAVVTKDNILTVTTTTQVPLQDYTVNISSIIDINKNEVKALTSTFKGFKPTEIKSDKFLISKIEPISKNTIKVFFTQEITEVPTIANFYDIYEDNSLWIDGNSTNMYIAKLTDSNSGVIIRLTNANFNVFKTYSLKTAGTMTDLTGIQMNNGSGDSMSFTPLVVDNFELKRVLTYAFSKQVVTVEFNKPVDLNSAQTTGSFQIIDSNGNISVGIPRINPNNSKQVLIGMLAPLTPNKTYKLHILNPVYDLEKSSSTTATNVEFSVSDVSLEKRKVILIEPISNTELRIHFNTKLDASSINLSEFLLSSSTDTTFTNTVFNKYYYNPINNPNSITLYLDPSGNKMKASTTYSLNVTSGLMDYNYQTDVDTSYTFTGNGNEKISPMIKDGIIVGGNTIKLEFNKDISSSNTLSSNYKVKYKKSDGTEVIISPSSASVFNNKYVVLHLSDLLSISTAYRLEYTAIVDYREDVFAGGSSKDSLLRYVN